MTDATPSAAERREAFGSMTDEQLAAVDFARAEVCDEMADWADHKAAKTAEHSSHTMPPGEVAARESVWRQCAVQLRAKAASIREGIATHFEAGPDQRLEERTEKDGFA